MSDQNIFTRSAFWLTLFGFIFTFGVMSNAISYKCQNCAACQSWDALNPICQIGYAACSGGYVACQSQAALWNNVMLGIGVLFLLVGVYKFFREG